ncbi:nucleoside 2-deoxyribosyltransferase [Bradyrhizobium yuanmingense]|uniref:nucleoside 2-deoxyribosyltransferase n=1 Tax=Bradyrhizobium yuanmingense TaxID=108015 RepID=UPI0012FA06C1|nr:nucleoside 2-deoxyribosyltransferase [Bradyrhizobium yuanmingense]MVT55940.1 nucleoside 2-deoxyribosyltransferase [Bradyrhizobium yuanmingense]
MHTAKRVYLAGPTVFLPNALNEGNVLKKVCAEYGLIGVFPLDELESDVGAQRIFEHNVSCLRGCDVVVADVSPFRGPHVDDGTAFEIGFANAIALPIFAYSRDIRPLARRISAKRGPDRRLRDEQELEVEDFGLNQNLMISCAIAGLFDSAAEAIRAAARKLS